MGKLFYIFIYMLLGAGLISCSRDYISDMEEMAEGQTVSIALKPIAGTRGFNDSDTQSASGSEMDNNIEMLRVLIFRSNGSLAYNHLITLSNPANPSDEQYTIELRTGNYDFAFIANESSDAALASELSLFSGSLTEIAGKSFSSAAFNSSDIIPMSLIERNVQVLGNGRYKVGNKAEVSGAWALTLTRLGIRVDMRIETEMAIKKDNFIGLEIHNIPATVPLFAENLNGGTNTNGGTGNYEQDQSGGQPRFIAVGEGSGGGFSLIEGSTTKYRWQKERIILPSSVFASADDKAKGITFKARYSSESMKPDQGTLGPLSTSPNNYTAPRNNYFLYTGNIVNSEIESNLNVEEWTQVSNGWKIPGAPYINVSQITANINLQNGARITFSSNMPKVWVAATVYDVNDAQTETNSVFNELVPGAWNNNKARRLHYEYNSGTGIGTGHIDIVSQVPDWFEQYPGVLVYKLVLCAGNNDTGAPLGELQRSVTVSTDNNWQHFYDADWRVRKSQYVGTFHRRTERGERIISNFSNSTAGSDLTGDGRYDYELQWKAEVENPTTSAGDFIAISDIPSFDPNVGVQNTTPRAELYQIADADAKTEIWGSGRTFFRIGIKKSAAAPTATSNRYGRVKVTLYNKNATPAAVASYYIYVRWGEYADFLMRPSDIVPQTGSIIAGSSREKAKGITPYNLTAPLFKDNPGTGTEFQQIGPGSSKFTDYPSQAGAMFYWLASSKETTITKRRYAYNPRPDMIMSLSNILPQDIVEWDWHAWDGGWNFTGYIDAAGTTISVPGSWDASWVSGSVSADNETCPTGYHRPGDGPTNRVASIKKASSLLESEFRQSLYYAPPIGDQSESNPYIYPGGITATNVVWGKMADGFFDRLPGDDKGGTVVASGTTHVAYMGGLFYNQANQASVFFPAAGRRMPGWSWETSTLGAMEPYSAGAAGYYWTSARSSYTNDPSVIGSLLPNGGVAMSIRPNRLEQSTMEVTQFNYAMSIRCFKD